MTVRKQFLLVVMFCGLVTAIIWYTRQHSMDIISTVNQRSLKNNSPALFQEPIKGDNHIIFIESSCVPLSSRKPAILLKPRQTCALESAAKANPNCLIYLLHTCLDHGMDASSPFYSQTVRLLAQYPNVKLFHITMRRYFSSTPLEKWFQEGNMAKTMWPVQHSSDVLRYLTLWKYGGTYMDLDIIVMRSLKGLAESFVVAESNYYVGSSVMRFTADGLGHQVMEALLEEIRTDFRGDQWAHNGPIIVTKVIQQLCGTNSTKQMTPEQCQGVVIYHPLMFFPVSGVDSKNLFNETLSAITMALIKSSRSYGTHTWNAITADSPIRFGSKQPFSLLAKRFCPSVYYNSGMVF